MRQELFKEMYDEIRLDKEQKNRIWNRLETEKEKGYTGFHTPAFVTICICIILVVGAPVLAANSSAIQRLIWSFNFLGGTESNLTKEQKDMYAKYGKELETEIVMNNVTLKLEALISDEHNIYIPFSANVEKVKLPDVVMEGIKNGKFLSVMSAQIPELDFDFNGDRYCFSRYTGIDSKYQKDGVISGCYLLTTYEREIKQGDVLQIIDRKKWEEEKEAGKKQKEIRASSVIDEITIDKVAKSRDISVKAIQEELPEGIFIRKMQLSPLSFIIEGFAARDAVNKSAFNAGSKVTVKLKDGSTVKQAATGSGVAISEEEYRYSIVLFEAPVNLDDVEGIQVHSDYYGSFDLWIPVGDEKKGK